MFILTKLMRLNLHEDDIVEMKREEFTMTVLDEEVIRKEGYETGFIVRGDEVASQHGTTKLYHGGDGSLVKV